MTFVHLSRFLLLKATPVILDAKCDRFGLKAQSYDDQIGLCMADGVVQRLLRNPKQIVAQDTG